MKIGIPRALLYYRYHVLWNAFFQELGIETVISPHTNKTEGLRLTAPTFCIHLEAHSIRSILLPEKIKM
mgnify:FL=1